MTMQYAVRKVFQTDGPSAEGGEPPLRPVQDEGGGDIVSLLEALDVRIAASLSGLRADASARDHLDQARQLISRTLRRAELANLQARPRPAAPARPQAMCYGGLPPRRARRLVEYIGLRLAERISVAELAAVVGLSRSYFCRAFRESFDVSPRRYIEARRIDQAQRLMLETELPLLQIALACGFGEAAHFSKAFRAVVGLSPSRWRRARRD